MLPLDGFKVLDLTRFLSGPYCTMVLADMGADVVKVENFPDGDDSRRLGPKVNDESYPAAMPNRNKRSLGIDLKSEAGRQVFLDLAKRADLVIENFRPGVMDRLGIGYEDLKGGPPRHPLLLDQRVRPDRTVPRARRLRHHRAGRHRLHAHDRPPRRRARQGRHRDQRHRGGRHRRVLDPGRADPPDAHRRGPVDRHLARRRRPRLDRLGGGRVLRQRRERRTHRHPAPPLDAVPGLPHRGRLRDGRREQPTPLGAPVPGRARAPRWLEDARYATLPDRMEHIDELAADIEAILVEHPTEHWVAKLDEAGVPGGPVLTYEEALHNARCAPAT
jgi:hypothetical protein